jgi:multisubunit Na+/H+ antiporter MnhE subunit
MINRRSVSAIVLLTAIWMILRENFTAATVLSGIGVSMACVYFCHRFLPLPDMSGIKIYKLAGYLLFLLVQVYIAGFNALKLLFKGSRVNIVQVKTKISHILLRTILVNSVTLIPGSVSMELTDDVITVLWLLDKSADAEYTNNAEKILLYKLEKWLGKAEN